MHLIWKRPDGFHGASPTDFLVVELEGNFRLWLHKKDKEQYPFRISGGWEEGEASVRINHLVNLLPRPQSEWLDYLKGAFNHSMKENPETFYGETKDWLNTLTRGVKGDTWEVEILSQALKTVILRLQEVKPLFLASFS